MTNKLTHCKECRCTGWVPVDFVPSPVPCECYWASYEGQERAAKLGNRDRAEMTFLGTGAQFTDHFEMSLNEAEARGRAEVQAELDVAVGLLEKALQWLPWEGDVRAGIQMILDARSAAKKGGAG